MNTRIISNASPLIALEQIGQLGLLYALFKHVAVPSAVVEEIEPTLPQLPSWITPYPLEQPVGARILQASLGAGESEAISLALEHHADRVLLDERQARRLAQLLGLRVTGTLGILLAAKQRGLIKEIKPALQALLKHNFRISDTLLEYVLRSAGE